MIKYRLYCPDCGATIIALYPEAVLWERCPGCFRHTWDTYDVKMADAVRGHENEHDWMRPEGHQGN